MRSPLLVCAVTAMCSLTAQTAANWNVNDCSGISRELFADLDAGKTAVIIWVMPCSQCISGALTAQTEVQNALASHPGKVVFYLADDYGNSSCGSLNTWANSNGVTDGIRISNNQVSMTPYGDPGMPKIVVAGGSQHKVFYNENEPDIVGTELRDAIAASLAEPVGMKEEPAAKTNGFPMPADDRFTVAGADVVSVTLMGIDGGLKQQIPTFTRTADGCSIDVSGVKAGVYLVCVESKNSFRSYKLVVQH
jgi:hypothetical protein